MKRTCEDCLADISDRVTGAVFCKSCALARRRRKRQDYYVARRDAGLTRSQRFPGTVGKMVTCATPGCGAAFMKMSGNHRFCTPCRDASDAFCQTVSNSRNPDRAHGKSLDDGRWGSRAAA